MLRSNRNGSSSTLLIYFRTASVDGIRKVRLASYQEGRAINSEAVCVAHSGDFLFLNSSKQGWWCGQGVVPSIIIQMEFGSEQWDNF